MRKIFIAWALALATAATVTSCNSSGTQEQPATAEHQGAAQDTTAAGTPAQQMAYICPMECEGSASMQPGKCPVCGMDLEKNPAYQAPADSTVTL
ncbi:heavy metal-binding domain-containing protein [Rufibacter psychrotolerans]|uniref:heavy metal-binding domain-containing protein n=1 Tax=Rufibacter psychrotolerans TaxID=2812556 RepID=UPI0019688D0D|nr:heavy metal-binding domain-containing protein [Rufibacter sp. SYSU D00308]